jgi:hypothetical protein
MGGSCGDAVDFLSNQKCAIWVNNVHSTSNESFTQVAVSNLFRYVQTGPIAVSDHINFPMILRQ